MLSRVAFLAAGLALGMILGAVKWRGSAEQFHREARMAAILAQAQQMPKGGIVVIGDSVTERVQLPEKLCGLPALNSGIGWSTSADWWPEDFKRVIDTARPSIVVVQASANDHGRYADARTSLASHATFTVDPPPSTVDGVHPTPYGARQFLAEIQQSCQRVGRRG